MQRAREAKELATLLTGDAVATSGGDKPDEASGRVRERRDSIEAEKSGPDMGPLGKLRELSLCER